MHLYFETIENIRDLGGIKTSDGREIKHKLLLRSSDMHRLSATELERLKSEFKLQLVIDFRSSKSVVNKKDKLDGTIKYHHLRVLDFLEHNSYDETIQLPPDVFFKNIYRMLATQPEAIATYRQFFKFLLAQEQGAVLWHCTSGKDRAGIAAVLLLHVLGCSLETIYQEHFATNLITRPMFEAKLQEIDPNNTYQVAFYEAFFIAKKEFIDEYFNEINTKFGGLDNYVHQQIGLSDNEVSLLRQRYLI